MLPSYPPSSLAICVRSSLGSVLNSGASSESESIGIIAARFLPLYSARDPDREAQHKLCFESFDELSNSSQRGDINFGAGPSVLHATPQGSGEPSETMNTSHCRGENPLVRVQLSGSGNLGLGLSDVFFMVEVRPEARKSISWVRTDPRSGRNSPDVHAVGLEPSRTTGCL